MSTSSCARTVGLLGLTAVALAGCGQSGADPRTAPPLVRIASAGAAEGGAREFTGIVGARVQSDLGFRVGGKVVARLVEAGQTVRRGQPLMRIDAADYALAAQAAAGTVAAARARAVQASADEQRYRDLVSAGAVSASAYDQAKAAALSARAQLSAAEAQARVSRNDTGYTLLVADADGVVAETLAEPGQVVAAGQTVVRLARSGPREAIVALPETLRPALGAEAEARTYSGLDGQARLRQLSDAADPATRTFEARFVLSGAPAAAPLGSTITIRVGAPGKPAAIAVPLAAIYDRGQGPGVWIVGSGNSPRVTWRPVRLTEIGDEKAVVAAGLRLGERFVALGAHMLHQGQPVRVAAGAVR
ncbi:RND family efflux transporter MFP subunit [Sphingomonas kyeonggiensis]|uniref:RND family efflux transporter MFP subunit n=1 Tax=Sphingomonas kyeonggiensis TaxID=1268553 RepID=A0A7W7K561_9SPHN|nr:efflux RND transporter periplasmic adaptor subunit [Sphingomonas kyeonggiensis]MBB4841271.1 RND family efflux transporter MFP subunit [Sphingomonas kyeonggiensis]